MTLTYLRFVVSVAGFVGPFDRLAKHDSVSWRFVVGVARLVGSVGRLAKHDVE